MNKEKDKEFDFDKYYKELNGVDEIDEADELNDFDNLYYEDDAEMFFNEDLTQEEVEYIKAMKEENDKINNNQYFKEMIDEKISDSFLGNVKRKFQNFKYNGGNTGRFDVDSNNYDERKKTFLVMAGVSLLVFIIIIFFVFSKK